MRISLEFGIDARPSGQKSVSMKRMIFTEMLLSFLLVGCGRENLPPEKISVSPECIKCGRCVDVCPEGCLRFGGKASEKNNNFDEGSFTIW